MLVRPEGDGVIAIGQASHAWLSGQLARAWGNERFDPPEPREEVCLAAEQHDVGMSEWDLAPPVDPGTRRPQSFMDMSLADHLRLWSAAPERLVTQSRYAALIVSMHGSALYERRDTERLAPAERDAVRAYLAGEDARQERLIDLLHADRAQARRNQRLVFAWDGLSLGLCLGWRDHVAVGVPTSGDATTDVRLEPVAGGRRRRFVLSPWPFSRPEVTVRCEARRLAARFDSREELRLALDEAPSRVLDFALAPPAAAGVDPRRRP